MKKDAIGLTGVIARNNLTVFPALENSKAHKVIKIVDYVRNNVVSKTIMKKTTGSVTVISVDIGEELTQKASPFDTYIQIIDGAAEVIINEQKIPASIGKQHRNTSTCFALHQCK
jgi:hypothetical protein